MKSPSMGGVNIGSPEGDIWSDPKLLYDLLALETPKTDPFTSWITYNVVDVYHNIIGRRMHVSYNFQRDKLIGVDEIDRT